MRSRSNRRGVVLFAAVATTLSGTFAFGQTNGTWITTNGSWAAPASWQAGQIANGAGALADFSNVDLTAATTVTLDGNQSAGTLTFADSALATAFGWSVAAGTPTTSALTLAGAGGTAGTLNVGYVAGEATRGLANNQGLGFTAPLIAPNGLNVNLGEFGTGVMGRRNNVTVSGAASNIAGTVSVNGIGDFNYTGAAAGFAGVTQLNITNPFTLVGGAQAAGNRALRVTLGTGTYNFNSTLTGGAGNSDARVGLSANGASVVVVNGATTLNGGVGATYEATGAGSLTLNGALTAGPGATSTGGSLLLRGTGTVVINGNVNLLNGSNTATISRTDAGTSVLNGTVNAVSISTGGTGTLRVTDSAAVTSTTAIILAGGTFESGGTLSRSLGTAPNQLNAAALNSLNVGATAAGLTVNLGGAAAPILFGGTSALADSSSGTNALIFSDPAFDPSTAGILGSAVVATNPANNAPLTTGVGTPPVQQPIIPTGTTVTAAPGGFGPNSVDLSAAAIFTSTTPFLANFSNTDTSRINGALTLNNATSAGDVTFVNPLDLNAVAGSVAVRTINVGGRTATLTGAITNSGGGAPTLIKGGAGKLVIDAPVNITGDLRLTGGSFGTGPNAAINVRSVELQNGTTDPGALLPITTAAGRGIYFNGGTIDLPSTTTGTFNFTSGTAIAGTSTAPIFLTGPTTTTRGLASGFNNTGSSPLTITLNGGATLVRGTPEYNLNGFKLGASSTASVIYTNDFDASAGGNIDFNSDAVGPGVELIAEGDQVGATPAALTMSGLGVAVFKGVSNHSGQTRIFSGTLAVTQPGAFGTLPTGFNIPMDANTSVLRFDAPMTVEKAGGTFQVGAVAANNYTLNTNGNAVTLQNVLLNAGNAAARLVKTGNGVLTVNAPLSTNALNAGTDAKNVTVTNGTLLIGSGTVNALGNGTTNRVQVGNGTGSNGTLEIASGATFRSGSHLTVGVGASTGTVTNNGTLNIDLELLMGNGSAVGSVATFNQNAGTTNNIFTRVSDGVANGTFNLNGGSLVTLRIQEEVAGATSTFNANGGTISPRVDAARSAELARFFRNVDNANILEGGLKIDTLGVGTQSTAAGVATTMTLSQSFQHGGAAAVDGGITKLGAGNVFMGGTSSYTGPTSVQVGTLTATAPRAFGAGTLVVAADAIADTAASLASPLVIGDLSIAAGGTVKLNNNKLVVDYTGTAPLANVKNAILPFFGDGTYNGTTGLTVSPVPTSTQGLGYADASTLSTLPTDFGAIDATSIVVKLTLKGDTNLDSMVAFADLVALAQNYGSTDGSKFWQQGDFNYNGNVGFEDLVPLAQNYGASLNAVGVMSVDAAVAARFESDWALAQELAVPEPTTLASLALLGGLLGRRRRANV